MSEAEKIVEKVIDTLDYYKGIDIVKIDLRRIENCFCSFFIVCHGSSSTQVASLSDNVYETVSNELGEKPIHVEGERQAQWVVMDYGNVVVHIFQKEQRDYYQLEEFWMDAEITKVEEKTVNYVR